MIDFIPKRRLEGGHRMTLFAWGRPRHFSELPRPTVRYIQVAEDTRVLAHCHWHAAPRTHPTLVALHGLEGSSNAHYMRGLSDKAYAAGFNVVRLNQRNCGGTEHLSPGLYHSGLTHDPLAVLRELIDLDRLPAIAIAGYSLGGNLALKLAGDLGPDHPPQLRAIVAVSPTIDLARCVAALERPENRLYQWNFLRNLKRRMRRKHRLFPTRYRIDALRHVRSVRDFDEAFTAPSHGFAGADDYYYRASALRVIDRVHVPTLIVAAADDPFVPPDQFQDPAIQRNAHVTMMVTPRGGHCAFVEEAGARYDGYWAERQIVAFCQRHSAA
jgi:hypothetical protein